MTVAVAASAGATTGEPAMHRIPAPTPTFPVDGGGSTGAIRASSSADTTYEHASTSSTTGAVTTWTSAPPAPGPATCASARLPLTSEFPST